jgi:choline dehydrogenase
MQKTKYDWEYYLEKTDNASLAIPDGVFWPRGKMLGGSSSLNGLLYIRGNMKDYDDWYEQGNPGWAYRHVLKYFRRSEKNILTTETDTDEFVGFHGENGPMNVDMFLAFDPIKDFMVEVAKETGFNLVSDPNAEHQMGFTYAQGTLERGKRVSTAKAFLEPIKDRENLHVIKNAQVTDVIIKRSKARGVNFVIGDKKLKVKAKKDIILSAGAIGSPHILLNSGVGPVKHLIEKDVKVHQNSPVGLNLQDHQIVYIPLKFHKSTAQPMPESDQLDDMFQYLMYGIGGYSHIGVFDFTGFVHTQNKSSTFPDIQFHYLQFRMGEMKRLKKFLDKVGYNSSVKKSIQSVLKDSELLMVMVVLLKPKSRGRIELKSNDPLEKPLIHGNYLSEREDIETLIRGVNIMKRMIHSKTAKAHEVEMLRVNLPGCVEIEFDKPGYWECYVKQMTSTVYQPTSTCRMGPSIEKNSVVDARLKVHGVKALRVVDASIMPEIISGGTNAPTIMIAEKAADLIKEDWKDVDEKSEDIRDEL